MCKGLLFFQAQIYNLNLYLYTRNSLLQPFGSILCSLCGQLYIADIILQDSPRLIAPTSALTLQICLHILPTRIYSIYPLANTPSFYRLCLFYLLLFSFAYSKHLFSGLSNLSFYLSLPIFLFLISLKLFFSLKHFVISFFSHRPRCQTKFLHFAADRRPNTLAVPHPVQMYLTAPQKRLTFP